MGAANEVALAMPRVPSLDGGEVSLPTPLDPSEAARVRRILRLQALGDIPDAISATGRLNDTTLLGPILADRYLRRPRDASDADLVSWLAHYADQADAPAVRDLLAARMPKDASVPAIRIATGPLNPPDPEESAPGQHLSRNPALDQSVKEMAQRGNTAAALRLISRTKSLSPAYGAQLRAEVAQAMLALNKDAAALAEAERAMTESQGRCALAGYIAGLAAWKLDRVWLARGLFEAASQADGATPSQRAAAAYWAARAHLRLRDRDGATPWMHKAADEPRSFYGLLARRSLGLRFGPEGGGVLAEADVDAVAATSHGLRAFALLQVGQEARAETELRALWPTARQSVTLGRSLLLVARKAGMTDLGAELASLVQAQSGEPHDRERFPMPALAPRGGFQLDPALVYALTRLESNFDPTATSAAGARGLMQIMPLTAGYMAANPAQAASYQQRLHDPAVNLEVGQRYVLYLADHDAVKSGLIPLLASYNAGPGNLIRWQSSIVDHGDPLLFIESIPNDETRAFVQHALAYLWIYAARLDVPSPSLDELATGQWPRFHRMVGAEAASLRMN